MENINYIFFEKYKKLDKLCGDLYQDSFGITHYIDDMKSISIMNYRNIPNWEMDLKELKRLRHICNRLAHAEDAFDENICQPKDIDWIINFYQRILTTSDPLALLYQNSKREAAQMQQTKIPNTIPQMQQMKIPNMIPQMQQMKMMNHAPKHNNDFIIAAVIISISIAFVLLMVLRVL